MCEAAPSAAAPPGALARRPLTPLHPAARQGGAAALLAGAAMALLVGPLALPTAPVLAVGALFLGTLGTARILAGGEDHFRNPTLRWAARATRSTWVEWGTGLYGLAALTCFLYLQSRWIFAPESTPGEFVRQLPHEWVRWSVEEVIQAMVNAFRSMLWPLRLHGALGGVAWITALIIGAGWGVRRLVWSGLDQGAGGGEDA